jgi:multiple sugar transport system permease protein
VYYVLVGGPLSVAVSLGTALLINSRLIRFKELFRTIYFAPGVTTLVAVAVVWRFMYHPRFGLLNYFLGFVGINPVDWLGDPAWAMPAIILMSIWKGFGYNMIIFVAGLQNIPSELYEAARIDGAGAWLQFRDITLPMLMPTTLFVSVITMINNFQLFAEPYVMTQGGPVNSTLSIVLLMYQQGFRWWNMGYSAAIAFVLFGIILAGSLVQSKLQQRSGI